MAFSHAQQPPCHRLIEDSDLKAAQELFGGQEKLDVKLDEFSPKTAKDFEILGRVLASTYVIPHASSQHYKGLLKALVKAVLAPSDTQFVKDVETTLAGLRTEKLKEERAKATAAKGVACLPWSCFVVVVCHLECCLPYIWLKACHAAHSLLPGICHLCGMIVFEYLCMMGRCREEEDPQCWQDGW